MNEPWYWLERAWTNELQNELCDVGQPYIVQKDKDRFLDGGLEPDLGPDGLSARPGKVAAAQSSYLEHMLGSDVVPYKMEVGQSCRYREKKREKKMDARLFNFSAEEERRIASGLWRQNPFLCWKETSLLRRDKLFTAVLPS